MCQCDCKSGSASPAAFLDAWNVTRFSTDCHAPFGTGEPSFQSNSISPSLGTSRIGCSDACLDAPSTGGSSFCAASSGVLGVSARYGFAGVTTPSSEVIAMSMTGTESDAGFQSPSCVTHGFLAPSSRVSLGEHGVASLMPPPPLPSSSSFRRPRSFDHSSVLACNASRSTTMESAANGVYPTSADLTGQ